MSGDALVALAVVVGAWLIARRVGELASEVRQARELQERRHQRFLEFFNMERDKSRPDPETLVEFFETHPEIFVGEPPRSRS